MAKILGAGILWVMISAFPAEAGVSHPRESVVYCYNISNVASTRKTQLKNCVRDKAVATCQQRAANLDNNSKGRAVFIKITAYGWVTGTKWKVYYSYRCDFVKLGTAWTDAPVWHPDSII